MNKSVIPPTLRAEMEADPEYYRCALAGYHECAGRITREHAMGYANKNIQERWAIIPLCASGHGVDLFQDAATVKKEVRVWVALNRGTDEELARFNRAVPSFFFQRDRLNTKYGVYIAPPVPSEVPVMASKPLRSVRAKITIVGPQNELDREARAYSRVAGCSFEEAKESLMALI